MVTLWSSAARAFMFQSSLTSDGVFPGYHPVLSECKTKMLNDKISLEAQGSPAGRATFSNAAETRCILGSVHFGTVAYRHCTGKLYRP